MKNGQPEKQEFYIDDLGEWLMSEDFRRRLVAYVDALPPTRTTQTLAMEVREARLEKRLSQRDLARISGISQATISKLEAGTTDVMLETAEDLLFALGKKLEVVDIVV